MDLSIEDRGLYAFGPFRLDPLKRALLREEQPVALTPKVFDTLLYLVENPDRVLGKDEMLAAIWPGRIVEESNISQCIFALRKALSGPGDMDRYIVTAPGRGYRFTAPVSRVPRKPVCSESAAVAPSPAAGSADRTTTTSIPAPPIASRARSGLRLAVATSLFALVAAGLAYTLMRSRHAESSALPRKVVLADFINLTGQAVFDSLPGKVLEIDLAQSPFLSLVPQAQARTTLGLMERPQDAPLTTEIAREVCKRLQGHAVISGSITAIGSHYLVTLESTDCTNAQTISVAKVEAAGKEDVPRALDGLAAQIRTGLNEPKASIRQFDVPIEQATTSSFDALQAYSLAMQVRAHGDNAGAIPLFKRAVEIDPSFAMAWSQLGSAYLGMREPAQANLFSRKAFELRNHTTENEKLAITAFYQRNFGSYRGALDALNVWARTYPNDWRPWANMASYLTYMAQYPEAIEAGRQAVRLNPDNYSSVTVLARAYKRANRYEEAKAQCRDAIARGLDSWDLHGLLYEIAFVENDTSTMAAEVALEQGKATEPWILDYQAHAAAFGGRLRQASALYEKAITLAKTIDSDDNELADAILGEYIETLVSLGQTADASRLLQASPRMADADEFMLAYAGAYDLALKQADADLRNNPDSATVTDLTVPPTYGAIYLGQNRPAEAIRAMQPLVPFELTDFYGPSLLGRAYLDTQAPNEAEAEFRKILDHRGVDGNSELFPLACLGLARALRMEGKRAESRAQYERLFSFWKDADADLPLLLQARQEYAGI